MTRMPFWSDSATFSAACRQTAQLRNIAPPSRHSFVLRYNARGVEATVKFATAAPDGVKRSSGSAVRLPTKVMGVSPAMKLSVVMSDVFCRLSPRAQQPAASEATLSACQPELTLASVTEESVDNLAH